MLRVRCCWLFLASIKNVDTLKLCYFEGAYNIRVVHISYLDRYCIIDEWVKERFLGSVRRLTNQIGTVEKMVWTYRRSASASLQQEVERTNKSLVYGRHITYVNEKGRKEQLVWLAEEGKSLFWDENACERLNWNVQQTFNWEHCCDCVMGLSFSENLEV